MDLLGGYSSNDGDGDGKDEVKAAAVAEVATVVAATATVKPQVKVQRADRRFLQAAPDISVMTRKRHGNELIIVRAGAAGAGQQQDPANTNSTMILEPVQGPNASDPKQLALKTGKTEANLKLDETDFKKQRTAFQRTGKAVGPGPNQELVVRTTLGYNQQRLELFQKKEEQLRKRPRPSTNDNGDGNDIDNEKEALVEGSDDEAVYGVWGPPTKDEHWHADNALSDLQKEGMEGLAPEQLAERAYLKERDRQKGIQEEEKEEESAFDRLVERKMSHLLPPKMESDQPSEPKTTFHGHQETNYKGQSWMAPPAGLASIVTGDPLEMDHHRCFVPKKCVHRFTGHNKGVHRIRLFPKTGHLLLSGGLDGKCKVWSVAGDKQVMRTYDGHTAGVRDLQFNLDGTKFVSASFDRFLRLWDTESGKVLQTFTNKKVPYCVQFYPHDDNLFVVGCSDNKIVTYDATTAEITQEYNHHLAPVNAIVFVEDHGTKMVSTGDDKKVLVWEWDIGVPIKYISDPTMHSMPSLTMHPSHQFIAAQSLDSNIAIFQAGSRFALQRKKKYSGHQVAGYACEMAISPDGQFLVSGDGNGKIYFWEWKRHKMLQKFKAHDKGPAICCVWHPLEPSVMFTCGWDGVIKMWQ
jgi:pre-mRNA-processing factor 17